MAKQKQNPIVAALDSAIAEKDRMDAASRPATIADTASAAPVGKPTLTDKQRKAMHDKAALVTDEAQGMLLAQQVKGTVRAVAADLQRIANKAFSLSVAAREACMKELNAWKKECKEQCETNGNMAKAGYDLRAARKVASSAMTRVSEFSTITKAMNAGFTQETLARNLGIDDPEQIGFHLIVAEARRFLGAQAAGGAGRPADPLAVKLQKWLAKQNLTGTNDEALKAKIEEDLTPYLPAASE